MLGISPCRAFDDAYRRFFELAAEKITSMIANADAFEQERRRAEALAELDRAKTTFFSNVSHEFRTPLTLMLGPMEELLTKAGAGLPAEEREQVSLAHRNGLRLLKLVNTMLDFSRIEAGRIQASYEPTDLANYTAELASVFRSAIEKAGLHLNVDCAPLSEPVYVDREMWEKIVLNLVSNAFKFTFEGEIEIKLTLKGAGAVLTVRDTGVGIPAEEMPRLFERFHRIANMRSRTHEGSGIGLALVQELVRLHGGTIQAESRLGIGTTFTVTLPLGKEHLPLDSIGSIRVLASTAVGASPFVEEALRWLPEEPTVDTALLFLDREAFSVPCPAGAEEDASGRPVILVADDNADMRLYLARLLTERYHVVTVPDGLAALSAAREKRPDLVLGDVMMPNLDGFGLVREIRADDALKTVPVILLSARAGEESRVEGLEHGADDYLIKPFSARELMARVAAHLDMVRIRREAEEQLHLHSSIVESVGAAIFATDANQNVLFWNKGAETLYGWRAEEAIGRHLTQLFTPISYEGGVSREDAVKEYIEKGWQGEARYLRKDGSVIDVMANGRVLKDQNGKITAMIIIHTDITERKRIEEALRESEKRFSTDLEAMEHIHKVSTGFVQDGNLGSILNNILEAAVYIAGAQRGTLQLLHPETGYLEIMAHVGFKQDYIDYFNLIPRNASAIWETALTRKERVIVENVSDSPVFTSKEMEVQLAAGVMAVQSTPLVNMKGELIGMFSTHGAKPCRPNEHVLKYIDVLARLAADTIERKRADDALKKSEELLELDLEASKLLQNISTQMLYEDDIQLMYKKIVDTAMQIMHSDFGSLQVLDNDREEGVALNLMVHIGFNERAAKFWERVEFSDNTTCSLAMRNGKNVVVPDIEECDFMQGTEDQDVYLQMGIRSCQSTPLISRSGKMLGMFSTHWRQPYVSTERELGSLSILARQAADLIERKKMEEKQHVLVEELEAADKNKNQFISVLSHELRNPLAAIMASLNLLEMTDNREQTAKAKQIINRQINQLTKLVDDLLDLTRINQNKIKLKKDNILLNEIVTHIVEDVKTEFDEKGVELMQNVQPQPLSVYADPVRITQCIGNILYNALKFTQESGTVWLSLQQEKNDAVITVKDNGIGISPELITHLFKPFVQGVNTLHRQNSNGLGLGLSIVKGIVEMHGGSVVASSEGLGMGATFIIRLPITAENKNHSGSESESGSKAGRAYKVLIIDDNKDFAEILCSMIGMLGHQVSAAYDGVEGVTKAKEMKPDVVFCDIGLPGKDGYEIAKILKKDNELKKAFLVAMTGYAMDTDIEQAKKSGFDGHLAKPVDMDAIEKILAEIQ